jgi:hypothetical protein
VHVLVDQDAGIASVFETDAGPGDSLVIYVLWFKTVYSELAQLLGPHGRFEEKNLK